MVTRKPIRLEKSNYQRAGAYFITICTQERQCLFWENVGTGIARPQKLSNYGRIVNSAIQNIPLHYGSVTVDKYVIMPNHVHMLLNINCDENGRAMPVPTISTIVQQMKGYVTKQIGYPIWQSRFYDHIIRDQHEYNDVWEYIDNNPLQWELDEMYTT